MNKNKKRKHIKKRQAKKEAVRKQQEEAIDKLIDCDFEEFKAQIINDKVPVGEIHGLRLILNNSYVLMARMKDELMQRIKEKPEEEEECTYNIQRCYIVLEKIEQKSVWLSDREKELLGEIN